jgi:hypothetical protein
LNVKTSESGLGTLVMNVNGNQFKMEYPANKEVIQGRLDGSDSPVTGPRIPPGAFAAYKAESPLKLSYTFKYRDKTLAEGTDTLSADGKILTEEEWDPGKMAGKNTYVYEKQ